MVQNNKVLTVSYGTFSCTLEGFDDSFETMKAIAEYFRDLAADDRYFGSEPPQPDAEMLTRIARRDALQRVEASQNESGLLLRAAPNTEAPAPVGSDAPVRHAPDADAVTTPPPEYAQPSPVQTAFTDAKAVDATTSPPADSIAAKLQRIRAVVSHSDVPPTAYSEDEESSLLANTAPPVDAVAAAFEAGALNEEDFAEPAQPEAAEIEDLQALDAEDVQTDDAPAASENQAFETAEPIIENDSEQQVQLTPDHLLDEEVEVATDDAQLPAEPLFSDLEEDTDEEIDEEDVPNILNVEDVAIESEDEPGDEAQDDQAQGVLTEEDEIQLLSEISEIEKDMAGRSSQKLTDDADPDQDISRLMAKTGEHMEDPSSSDARETYSHLRTAVAATEADRDGQPAPDTSPVDEYRVDLASAVSPRRPEVNVTSIRPEADAPAPLKLVAEQRVDDQSESNGPVMPRRVTTQVEEAGSEEGGFAQFAQDQGAQSLQDLLEAAAAYLSFIEGQQQFSRPQLMNKVRSLKQDEFNREESLRSFGQLLRDGKIEKAGGGRFAASDLIGFRPDDERAVG
ncbi:hypothetical protein [Ruegeria atlantica]|uniref:hypothetical protein n=1 Tax=Ruegeria atlantica TaxID=81569 RepID=UPI00147E3608|nr:hypothetical protein [Ruegeria atlantica]